MRTYRSESRRHLRMLGKTSASTTTSARSTECFAICPRQQHTYRIVFGARNPCARDETNVGFACERRVNLPSEDARKHIQYFSDAHGDTSVTSQEVVGLLSHLYRCLRGVHGRVCDQARAWADVRPCRFGSIGCASIRGYTYSQGTSLSCVVVVFFSLEVALNGSRLCSTDCASP